MKTRHYFAEHGLVHVLYFEALCVRPVAQYIDKDGLFGAKAFDSLVKRIGVSLRVEIWRVHHCALLLQ